MRENDIRVAACLSAMEGISDPVAFVEAARGMMEAFEQQQASKDAPRLLTEREWREVLSNSLGLSEVKCALLIDFLRERGLIAPEPVVDPLDAEVRGIVHAKRAEFHVTKIQIEETDYDYLLALAALRRGMELAREGGEA